MLVLVLFFLHIRGDDPSTRQLPLRAKLQRLDFGGIVLLIGAVCCLFIALQQGGTTVPWRSARIIGLFIGFGLISIVFGFLQWKLRERATIPVRFLRQKTVVFGSLFLFFDNMSNYIVSALVLSSDIKFKILRVIARNCITSHSTSRLRKALQRSTVGSITSPLHFHSLLRFCFPAAL